MKYFGAFILLGLTAVLALGIELFTTEERGQAPSDVRRGPGGVLLWHSGYRGGK